MNTQPHSPKDEPISERQQERKAGDLTVVSPRFCRANNRGMKCAGLLLHGRNRPREEMVQLAVQLGIGGIHWLAPAAQGQSWYPRRMTEPLQLNEPWLSNSIDQCDRVLEEAYDGGRLSPPDTVLMGFSQGASLAIEYALRRPGHCGAVVAFTGGVIGATVEYCRATAGRLNGLRVLITGSDIDEWLPPDRARESATFLGNLGADVRLLIYPEREHVVSPDEIAAARVFLRGYLFDSALDGCTR